MPQPIFLTVPVGRLRKNPWNTNRVSPEGEAKIRKSIERNGLFKPVLVRTVAGEPGYEIIGGEHRWEQAIELGHTDVPICNLGDISELQAKEIGVIDNARYGADDTLSFSELLRELGNIDDLQEFLPYGSADLDAIFSATNIALDDLELHDPLPGDEVDLPEEEAFKPAKTHNVMRFKVSIADSDRLIALISATKKTHDFTHEDDLTNAGDALVQLLLGGRTFVTASASDEIDNLLERAFEETDNE
jgi:ParB-like chromosome segregation protein Spo0J